MLHAHLFVSFAARAVMFVVKELSFEQGVALASDVVVEKGRTYVTENYVRSPPA